METIRAILQATPLNPENQPESTRTKTALALNNLKSLIETGECLHVLYLGEVPEDTSEQEVTRQLYAVLPFGYLHTRHSKIEHLKEAALTSHNELHMEETEINCLGLLFVLERTYDKEGKSTDVLAVVSPIIIERRLNKTLIHYQANGEEMDSKERLVPMASMNRRIEPASSIIEAIPALATEYSETLVEVRNYIYR